MILPRLNFKVYHSKRDDLLRQKNKDNLFEVFFHYTVQYKK